MVNVFYCISKDKLDKTSFNYLFDHLPPAVQYEILKYRQWQDRQRVLFGKTLLKEGLALLKLNTYSLDRLQYTKLKRPYFDNSFDFNISHSENMLYVQ